MSQKIHFLISSSIPEVLSKFFIILTSFKTLPIKALGSQSPETLKFSKKLYLANIGDCLYIKFVTIFALAFNAFADSRYDNNA